MKAAIQVKSWAPFDGDGRLKSVTPRCVMAGTAPIRVTNAAAQRTIDHFKSAGRTMHSAQGGTLWVILAWCHEHGVPYRLSAAPGLGYMVEQYAPDIAAEGVQPRGPADGC